MDNQVSVDAAPKENALRRRLVTTACMLSAFMVAVEATIVATAMPTIVGQLGEFRLFTWVFAAYILTSAVTAPVYGRLADLYGRKRMYYVGAGLFLIGSTLCGFAPSMGWLIAFRTLQGLGAGALQPLTITILGDLYRGEQRARAQAWQSSVWGIAAVIGPVVGAFIVEHLHWALVFWINVPIGIVTLAVLALVFEESLVRREHRVDYLGSALLMAGAAAVLMATIQAEDLARWLSAALFAGGIAVLAALFVHERRAPEPIVPLALWRTRNVAVSNIGALCIGGVLSCSTLFLPTYVQGVLGRSPTVAGIVYSEMSLAWSIGSVLSARVLARTSFRITAAIGSVVLMAGAGLLIVADVGWNILWIAAGAFAIGIGMGFCNTSFILACQSGIGWGDRGGAVSSNIFLRTIGMALGAGIGGAVLNFSLARYAPEAGNAVRQILAPELRALLDAQTLAQVSMAIGYALHQVYIVAGVLAAAALASALALPRALKLDRTGT